MEELKSSSLEVLKTFFKKTMNIRVKWISDTESAIAPSKGEPKVPVKKGDIINVSADKARQLIKMYKHHVVVLDPVSTKAGDIQKSFVKEVDSMTEAELKEAKKKIEEQLAKNEKAKKKEVKEESKEEEEEEVKEEKKPAKKAKK